jgi:hypothetical protein
MAIKVYDRYGPRANPADSNYPNGSYKNESAPGTDDGTPLEVSQRNDILGYHDSIMIAAGLTNNGLVDTVVNSQMFEASAKIHGLKFKTVSDMVASQQLKSGMIVETSEYNTKVKQKWEIVSTGTNDIERGTISVGSGLFAKLLHDGFVLLEWFGSYGDESAYPSTSSSSVLQKMLNYCYRNKVKKASTLGLYHRFDDQVIIPFFDNNRDTFFDFDWNGMLATGNGNTSSSTEMFISGYIGGGDVPVVNTGTQEMQVGYNFRMYNGYVENALRFIEATNMLGTSKVYHFFTNNVAQAVKSHRCFYGSFWDIVAWGGSIDPSTIALDIARFEVNDNNNIMPISECAANGHPVCLDINGASEALEISDMGLEGWTTNAVRISGTAYSVLFSNPYIETGLATGGAVKVVSGTAPSVTFDNGWYLGDFPVIDPTTKPIAGLYWHANNMLETDTRLFDQGTQYCLGRIEFPMQTSYSNVTNNRLSVPSKIGDAPESIHIDAPQILYSSVQGPSQVLAKSSLTQAIVEKDYQGRADRGFVSGCIPFTNSVTNASSVTFNTSIINSEAQIIYVNLKVAHSSGTWHWRGILIGSEFVKLGNYTQNDPVASIDGDGLLVITTPTLTTPSLAGGTIRIL